MPPTTLHNACRDGDTERARQELNAIPVDKKDENGMTALMVASEKGHVDVVRALVELGADVAQAKPDGMTALMLASEKGHEAVAQFLRDH